MAKGRIRKAIQNWILPEQRQVFTTATNTLGLPYGSVASPIAIHTSLQLSAVYRCVEVISDAIASELWDVQEYTAAGGWKNNPFNPISILLNNEPSQMYNSFTLMKVFVSRILLWGNGYIWIHRDGSGNPETLELVTVQVKRFLRKDGTSYYEVGPEHEAKKVEDYDMIHVLNQSENGLIGESVIYHALLALGLAVASESSAKGFFLSGANMAGILQVQSKLDKKKADEIKASWAEAFDVTTGTPGGIAVMEGGLEFSPVTINPRDAQMLETRKFNVVEICRFFGVHPSKAFDDNNLTYSNIESLQLGFITDTIAPRNGSIAAEFNRKLLRPSQKKFTRLSLNIETLLKANLDAKANYTSKMFQNGGYTVNEVREMTGQPSIPGGDQAYIQVNMQPVKKVMEIKKKPEDE